MITSVADERVKGVRTTQDDLIVTLFDGRTLAVPLSWYPRLLHATEEQRNDWRLRGAGYAIHWPQIDEDLSVEGMLRGVPAPGARLESSPAEELRDRYVSLAKDFYVSTLDQAKGQLENNRSDLESLLEQLPGDLQEARSHIQGLVDSFDSIVSALDEAAQQVQGQPEVTPAAVQKARELGVDLSQI